MGSPPQCYRDCKAEEQSTGSWMRPRPMVAALPEHRHLCPSSPPASVPSFGPPSHWRAAWDRISAYTGDSKMLLVPHRLRGCGCHTEASATCCGHSGHASLHPSSLQPRSLTLSLRMFPQRKRPKALLCKKTQKGMEVPPQKSTASEDILTALPEQADRPVLLESALGSQGSPRPAPELRAC